MLFKLAIRAFQGQRKITLVMIMVYKKDSLKLICSLHHELKCTHLIISQNDISLNQMQEWCFREFFQNFPTLNKRRYKTHDTTVHIRPNGTNAICSHATKYCKTMHNSGYLSSSQANCFECLVSSTLTGVHNASFPAV